MRPLRRAGAAVEASAQTMTMPGSESPVGMSETAKQQTLEEAPRIPADRPIALPKAASPRSVPDDAPLHHPSLYFNRELSWLDFNWRVLSLAMDESGPLLERVRFLGIAQANLDEFWRKRVGGLKRQVAAGVSQLSPDGRSPQAQLALIQRSGSAMQRAMRDVWDRLRDQLEKAEVHIREYEDLDERERKRLHAHFHDCIYPILTPLAVDSGHPFPFISNLSLSLAVRLRHPGEGTRHFARVKIPTGRGRWIALAEKDSFITIDEVVRAHIDELFPGMEVEGAWLFRVTRNADMQRDEEEAEDLLAMISEELRQRRFAAVVRLEIEESMPHDVRWLLCREMDLDHHDIQVVRRMIDLTDITELAEVDRPALRFPPWEPVVPRRLAHLADPEEGQDFFAVLRFGDILVHHPYDSFAASVQQFIEAAAVDPDVLAIKQTLYRTSRDSAVVKALIRAAEHGKQVAVLVEVKARFDEQNNIEWGQALERAGVHVTYGVGGLKTHAKVTLVVRQEGDRIRTYCHIGTGNYHADTARLYSDVGLITADPEIGTDMINLFHFLTGYAPGQKYQKLLIAPREARPALIEAIESEIEHARDGGEGRIILKMNAIDDVDTIAALYRASRAGVSIDLIVRGHTRLRPGLPGYSDNIRVSSILGRFLEHDRIYWFANGGKPRVWIGSADWRRRNLDDRVEALVRVDAPELQARLKEILDFALEDNSTAWDLHPDGRYVLRSPDRDAPVRAFQTDLMRAAVKRRHPHGEDAEAWRPTPAPGIMAPERRAEAER